MNDAGDEDSMYDSMMDNGRSCCLTCDPILEDQPHLGAQRLLYMYLWRYLFNWKREVAVGISDYYPNASSTD